MNDEPDAPADKRSEDDQPDTGVKIDRHGSFPSHPTFWFHARSKQFIAGILLARHVDWTGSRTRCRHSTAARY